MTNKSPAPIDSAKVEDTGELYEAVKAFYNATIGDKEVIVRAPNLEKRNAIILLGDRLCAELIAIRDAAPAPSTQAVGEPITGSAPVAGTLTIHDVQKKAIEYGFEYWRAPDAHGVTGTKPQAIELLQDLLGVEVEIEDNGCSTCNGTGMIGGPSFYAPDEGGERCPDCNAAPASPAASVLTDAELTALIRKVEDKLGIAWFVPDDSETYAWRTTNTNERLKYARALLAASMGGEPK